MFFLAIVLTLRTQRVCRNQACSLHLLEPTCWRAVAEQDELSMEPPLMMTVLPAPPERLLLRLVWGCDASSLPQVTSWWTGLREGISFQIGPHHGWLESVHFNDSPWATVSTWADVMTQRPCRHLRLTFLTPMIPTLAEDYSSAFPEPVPVFSRLHERWNALGGPHVSMTVEELVATARCVVSDYRITMRARPHGSSLLRGYDGWVAFEYRARQVEAITTLNRLARLAFYTGLGYYTERGMGATNVVQEG